MPTTITYGETVSEVSLLSIALVLAPSLNRTVVAAMPSQPELPMMPLPAAHDAEKTTVVDEAQVIEDIQREEGTYCQSQLGDKPPRKHFFSPLDPSCSEAVHGDAETVRFNPEEEVRSGFSWLVANTHD